MTSREERDASEPQAKWYVSSQARPPYKVTNLTSDEIEEVAVLLHQVFGEAKR